MRRIGPVTLALVLLALPAWAQDAEAPPPRPEHPPPRPDHPLLRAADQQLRARQVAAGKRVLEVRGAIAHATAAAFVDLDEDSFGEIPTLPEILGLLPWRGRTEDAAGMLLWPGAKALDDQTIDVDGYRFRIVLPDAARAPAAALGDVSPDESKTTGVIVAWPSKPGRTGVVSFAAHAISGDEVARDDDPGDGPPDVRGLLATGPASSAATGWRPLDDLVPRLRNAQVRIALATKRPWTDPSWSEELLTRSFWAARALRKLPPQAEPPRLRVAGPAEIHAALVAELEPMLSRLGGWVEARAGLPATAAATPAKYVPAERTLLFAPDTLEVTAALAGVPPDEVEDLFRAVLLHEAVHAADFDLEPLAQVRDACATASAFLCWNAVIEGHAQHVARRIATQLHLLPAMDAMTDLVRGSDDSDVPAVRAGAASREFIYIDGEAFIAAVAAASPDGLALAALRDPPTRPGWISEPRLWIARTESPPPDFDAALAPLAALDPPGATARRSALIRRSVAALLSGVPGVDGDAVAAGIDDGESRTAVSAAGDLQIQVVAILCRDADAAAAYVTASRAFQRQADTRLAPASALTTRYEDLATPFAGYTARKTARAGDVVAYDAVVRTIASGPFVVEVTVQSRVALDAGTLENVTDAARRALEQLTRDAGTGTK